MTDHPLPLTAPEVRALLREAEKPGTGKTQTRRVLKLNGEQSRIYGIDEPEFQVRRTAKLPYAPGDRICVKERWATVPRTAYRHDPSIPHIEHEDWWAIYAASFDRSPPSWKPSIHMPRWASRLTLTITDVRVQRVQEISEEDAKAEGVESDSDGWRDYLMPSTQCCGNARDSFHTLWDSLNAKRGYGWDANPWVCALTFTVEQGNIDALKDAA